MPRGYREIFMQLGMSGQEVGEISHELRNGTLPRYILETVLEEETPENPRFFEERGMADFAETVGDSLMEQMDVISIMGDALKYAKERKGKIEEMLTEDGFAYAVAGIFADYFRIRYKDWEKT